jgi:metal-responsive CopG/Arc/MetJ family transcriptional regulator
MAKVMVSLPDELLAEVDQEAHRLGTTRSGYLRSLAESSLHRRSLERSQRMAAIDAMDVDRSGHGGDVAALVKLGRPRQ